MKSPPISQVLTAYIWLSPLLGRWIPIRRFLHTSGGAVNNPLLLLFLGVIRFVYVSVEHRKPDEERYTDEVFDPFYVLVIVDQGEYLFYLANR
jgi:hypothetical protein